ncbi:hypothetical protein SASPL_101836 [Salvia splendens]|uniref:RNase H type-1 domain-containing protein n=1 Tax=Salvia splendens TaxID=180675 RepID=A0A8X8YSG5_SALSN|nr:hypothetical protein SASPL_101836 [Salvia splendens]
MWDPGVRLPHKKVKELWRNGEWNHVLVPETVIVRIQQYLQQLTMAGKLGKAQWSGCDLCEQLDTTSWKEKPRKQIKQIKWNSTDTGWLKLNVDGVWSNVGAGAGGALRDEGGNLVYGFKTKVVARSRIDAILQAVCIGLNMVLGRGQQVWIEMGE